MTEDIQVYRDDPILLPINDSLWEKGRKVINSCVTFKQLKVAEKYVYLIGLKKQTLVESLKLELNKAYERVTFIQADGYLGSIDD